MEKISLEKRVEISDYENINEEERITTCWRDLIRTSAGVWDYLSAEQVNEKKLVFAFKSVNPESDLVQLVITESTPKDDLSEATYAVSMLTTKESVLIPNATVDYLKDSLMDIVRSGASNEVFLSYEEIINQL